MGCKFNKIHVDDNPIVHQADNRHDRPDTNQGGKRAAIVEGDIREDTERDASIPTVKKEKVIVTNDSPTIADDKGDGDHQAILEDDIAESTERDLVRPTTSKEEVIVTHDTAVVTDDKGDGDHQAIAMEDPQAFQTSFVEQRQAAIDNVTFRSAIGAWKAKSMQELIQLMRAFAQNKSVVDQHWMIFYWISLHIEYDVVSYFSGTFPSQSGDVVFQTNRAVCAGYSNLYKYLCDQLQLRCEVVSGYSKGHGFEIGTPPPTKTDHAWNAVEIDHHWYLLDSTWGTGHLSAQKKFERKLEAFYFLTRPNEMIYDHLPGIEKWQLLQSPITMQDYLRMPKVYPSYFVLDIQWVSPLKQAHIDLVPGQSFALVQIRTPPDVKIMVGLKLSMQEVEYSHRVVFNREEQLHYCYFAPQRIGKHTATIFGKRDDKDNGSYRGCLDLMFDVKELPTDPISYPRTWPNFFDLNLEVIAPKNRANAVWPTNASYAEVLMRAPSDVQLSCSIKHKNIRIENGTLAQFDKEKGLWQLRFAPEQIGAHELLVFAKKSDDSLSGSSVAVQFSLHVTQLQSPIKFPITYGQFAIRRCHLYSPINGVMKKNSVVPIHCLIPDAVDVNLQVDSKWATAEGYRDSVLKRDIAVGERNVTIYAKFGDKLTYDGLVKYTIE